MKDPGSNIRILMSSIRTIIVTIILLCIVYVGLYQLVSWLID